jgi:hypothetical protein
VARRIRNWTRRLPRTTPLPPYASSPSRKHIKTLARQFLLAAIDEGVSIQVALGKVIRAIGVKEFAASVGMGPLWHLNPRLFATTATIRASGVGRDRLVAARDDR